MSQRQYNMTCKKCREKLFKINKHTFLVTCVHCGVTQNYKYKEEVGEWDGFLLVKQYNNIYMVGEYCDSYRDEMALYKTDKETKQ